MARTARRAGHWPWIVGIILLALLVWALSDMFIQGEHEGVQVEESVPAPR